MTADFMHFLHSAVSVRFLWL